MTRTSRISHVIGFDDAPFPRAHRGDVMLVGAVFGSDRLEGVLSGKVRRDGANSTAVIIDLVANSRFYRHTQLVLLQGIAFAGFNVVDINRLNRVLDIPVVVVMRKFPDMDAIKEALLRRVRGGSGKWRLIQQAGEPEAAAGVFIQRAGISLERARRVIERLALHSLLPEPLRTAHLIAGGVADGHSRHRA